MESDVVLSVPELNVTVPASVVTVCPGVATPPVEVAVPVALEAGVAVTAAFPVNVVAGVRTAVAGLTVPALVWAPVPSWPLAVDPLKPATIPGAVDTIGDASPPAAGRPVPASDGCGIALRLGDGTVGVPVGVSPVGELVSAPAPMLLLAFVVVPVPPSALVPDTVPLKLPVPIWLLNAPPVMEDEAGAVLPEVAAVPGPELVLGWAKVALAVMKMLRVTRYE